MDEGVEDGFGMIQVHYIQAHPLLCGPVPNRPGPVPVCGPEVEDPSFRQYHRQLVILGLTSSKSLKVLGIESDFIVSILL